MRVQLAVSRVRLQVRCYPSGQAKSDRRKPSRGRYDGREKSRRTSKLHVHAGLSEFRVHSPLLRDPATTWRPSSPPSRASCSSRGAPRTSPAKRALAGSLIFARIHRDFTDPNPLNPKPSLRRPSKAIGLKLIKTCSVVFVYFSNVEEQFPLPQVVFVI